MHRKYLEQWLRDAYAMEKAAIEILEKQVKSHKEFPECQTKLQEHLEQTKWQAEQVAQCLRKLGTKSSALKEAVGKFMGNMAVMTNAPAEDHVIKDLIADASFEHMEIASYRSLIAAADDCGEQEIKATCQQILHQEEAAAQWIEEHIPQITQQFLSRHPAEV